MKKPLKWLFMIIVFIVLAIFLFALWKIFLNTRWLDLKRATYENSRYNFSLKYPRDWILGEQETNNAGREIYSPDETAICYAYGFANALMNDQGNPQSLEEFIDWLFNKDSDSNISAILHRQADSLSGKPAISLLIELESGYKEAIYILNKENGIGFYCIYPDMESMNKYTGDYSHMVDSFEIKSDLDSETTKIGTEDCANLLNGTITPFKDLQSIVDSNYTEVTIISREFWNRKRLPKKVIDLEDAGYRCYPMPLEFDSNTPDDSVYSEPAVKTVEWQCELEFNDWKYFNKNDSSEIQTAEKSGYNCTEEKCFTNNTKQSSVWLCAK